MSKTNYNLTQGIGFEIMTDIGVPKEAYLECERAIACILLQHNDKVDIHQVGHYDLSLKKTVHSYRK